jgi:hypothetical protein
MVVILLKRLGLGTLIGAFIALIGVIVVLSVRMARSLDSYTKLWESRVKSAYVRLVEIAHAAYHTLQVELLNAHHAIHVEVLSVHHVMQVDVTRHHEVWLRLSGTGLLVGLMFLLAVSIWTSGAISRAISISILLLVKNRQMTAFGPAWRRGRFSAHNARYFLPG